MEHDSEMLRQIIREEIKKCMAEGYDSEMEEMPEELDMEELPEPTLTISIIPVGKEEDDEEEDYEDYEM